MVIQTQTLWRIRFLTVKHRKNLGAKDPNLEEISASHWRHLVFFCYSKGTGGSWEWNSGGNFQALQDGFGTQWCFMSFLRFWHRSHCLSPGGPVHARPHPAVQRCSSWIFFLARVWPSLRYWNEGGGSKRFVPEEEPWPVCWTFHIGMWGVSGSPLWW